MVLSIKAGQKRLLAIIIFTTLEGFLFLLTPGGIKKKYRPAFMGATQIVRITKVWPLFAHLYLCIKKKEWLSFNN